MAFVNYVSKGKKVSTAALNASKPVVQEAYFANIKKEGNTLKIEKVSEGNIGNETFIVVKTDKLKGKKVQISIHQGEEKVITEKDNSIEITFKDIETTLAEAIVGGFENIDSYANKVDLYDLAIAAIKLVPKDEEKIKEWETALDTVDEKKISLNLLVDAHTDNGLADGDVEYKGKDSGSEFIPDFSLENVPKYTVQQLYDAIFEDAAFLADEPLSIEAFTMAMKGYYVLLNSGDIKVKNYLTISDYSTNGPKRWIYIINLDSKSLVLKDYKIEEALKPQGDANYNDDYKSITLDGRTVVANGNGRDFRHIPRGKLSHNHFGNYDKSKSSRLTSLGFYITDDNSYKTSAGKHKKDDSDRPKKRVGLRFEGQDRKSNSHVHSRGVVIHEAWYANDNGGRSNGCLAFRQTKGATFIEYIVDMLKGGTCIFAYHDSYGIGGKHPSEVLADSTGKSEKEELKVESDWFPKLYDIEGKFIG